MKMIAIALAAAAALAGCATHGPTDSQRLALYQAHAGEPLNQIRYITPQGWDRIDDQHIVLTMRPREQYLLRLSGPCLTWSSGPPVIGIKTHMGSVLSKFDSITANGAPMSCRIDEIRPLDTAALRAGEQALRAQSAGT